MPAVNINLLKIAYNNNVEDIDLWVGGLAEAATLDNKRRINNTFRMGASVVGATFDCLLRNQFRELRKSDRFYFENAPDIKKGTNSTAFTLSNFHKFEKIIFLFFLIKPNFKIN